MEYIENGKKIGAGCTEDKRKSKGWLWWLPVLVFAAVVITMSVLTILKFVDQLKRSPSTHRPQKVIKKYADALEIAMQFFDVQKCNSI